MDSNFFDNCIVCGGVPQSYVVYWDVWYGEADLEAEDGQVCLPCLERLIGRVLNVTDFFPYPLTVATRDRMLINRIGAPILKAYSDGTSNVDEPLWMKNNGLNVLYRQELFDWYTACMGEDFVSKNFFQVLPGREDPGKRIICASVDYPAWAISPPTRGVYNMDDQLYRRAYDPF